MFLIGPTVTYLCKRCTKSFTGAKSVLRINFRQSGQRSQQGFEQTKFQQQLNQQFVWPLIEQRKRSPAPLCSAASTPKASKSATSIKIRVCAGNTGTEFCFPSSTYLKYIHLCKCAIQSQRYDSIFQYYFSCSLMVCFFIPFLTWFAPNFISMHSLCLKTTKQPFFTILV